MKTRSIIAALAALAALPALSSCDDAADGEGALVLEIWGEEFIEQGIPAEEFADGWSVVFDRFLVNVGQIGVAEEGATPALEVSGFQVFDLVAADGPVAIAKVTAPAGTYGQTAYTIAPADGDSAIANAAEADLQRMIDGGWSVFVEGTATDGTDTVTFAWGFGNATVYDPCHSGGVLEDGGAVAVQLTIHGDHLFYDSAVSEDPALRFADIALADADDDGEVTPEELAALDIAPLPYYGVGSLDIDNLWDYIEHMTTTLGHIDGEGHCGQ
jgi:hypothetical protein